MVVLLALYHLLFEREKMHRFNRFYLLVALVLSLAIPFVTIITYIEYIEMPVVTESFAPAPITINEVVEQPANYWPYTAWAMYGLVSLIMAIRFAKNIYHFISKATVNKRASLGNATLVLMNEKTLPHTFLNYIFINRAEYEARQIEDELYTHEYTHVKQKHTLDILFIEILRIVFWFNPLLYFYKSAIQLNHEFLADEKVIETNSDTIYYQNLLLSKAQRNTSLALASQLTFSLTKKRLIMMTKTTSILKSIILKLSVLPVVTGIAFLFCTETVAQTKDVAYKDNDAELQKAYVNTQFRFKDKDGNIVDKKYTDLTSAEKKDLPGDPTIKSNYIEFNQASEEQMANERKIVKDVIAQTSGPDKVYSTEEVSDSPLYPGGTAAFYKHVAKGVRFPKELSGHVALPCSFVVEKNGTVSNVKVLKDPGYGMTEQMTGILTTSEKWTPGKKDGKAVRTLIVAPITLSAPKKVSSWEEAKEYLEQEDKIVENKDLTKQPEYKGEEGHFLTYVKKNFKTPKVEKGIHKSYFSFVVEKDGSLSNVKAVRSQFAEIDTEAIRVISKSEKWSPGEIDGKPVRTMYQLPIVVNVN